MNYLVRVNDNIVADNAMVANGNISVYKAVFTDNTMTSLLKSDENWFYKTLMNILK